MDESASSLLMAVVPVVLAVGVAVVSFVSHRRELEMQRQGVIWLQSLRILIAYIQRHRGLTSGVLCGDDSMQSNLDEVQQQVDQAFARIENLGDWIKRSPSWHGIHQHWLRLTQNVRQRTLSQTIDQHNRLIMNILVLIDDVALTHHLGGGSTFKPKLWRDLLTLAEYIGQARALGVVLTAQEGNFESSTCIKACEELYALDQKILATLERPRYRNVLDGKVVQDIIDFLSYTDDNVLRDGPHVNSTEFYRVATGTIDRLFERFDRELQQVNRRLIS